jgi:hypothetical protein
MLVAGAGLSRECDELAAWAPLVFDENESTETPAIDVSALRVPGLHAYLCAPGSTDRKALADIAAGCSRILGAS